MKINIYLLCLLVFAALPTFAKWAFIPIEQLVQKSDIVVVGTLRDVSESSKGEVDYSGGNIVVDETLLGNVKAGEKLKLVWQNASGLVCPRVEHRQNQSIKGVWLLTRDKHGKVRADYPLRFVPLEKKAEVIELLKIREQSNAATERQNKKR